MEQSRDSAKRARHRQQVAAKAAREEDKRRKEAERQRGLLEQHRQEMHEQQLVEDAVVLTDKATHRMQKLAVVLRASLSHLPEPLDFERMKQDLPEGTLAPDIEPLPMPQWEEYAPTPPKGLGRLLQQRGERTRLEQAEQAYAHAVEKYRTAEADRRRRLDEARAAQDVRLTAEQRAIRDQNREVEAYEEKVFEGDRHAVTEYYEQVFASFADKGMPRTRRVAYVQESKLLLVEWHVPGIEVVPREREYRYSKSTNAIEIAKWRSIANVRETYHNLLAQLALRAVAAAFEADPNWLVETVVFDAVVVDTTTEAEESELPVEIPAVTPSMSPGSEPASEVPVPPRTSPERLDAAPCVFSMRATRHQLSRIKLTDLTDTEPLEQAHRRFGARISPFPDDLTEVTPLLAYDLADPDARGSEDEAPDLFSLPFKDFEALSAALVERMGYQVELIRPDDNDCDLLATRDTPDGDERLVVHVRRVARMAGPGDVRTLVHAVRRERADAGMLLVTGGFDTRAFEYATGKDVQLYDGHAMLALLQAYDLSGRASAARVGAGAGASAGTGARRESGDRGEGSEAGGDPPRAGDARVPQPRDENAARSTDLTH